MYRITVCSSFCMVSNALYCRCFVVCERTYELIYLPTVLNSLCHPWLQKYRQLLSHQAFPAGQGVLGHRLALMVQLLPTRQHMQQHTTLTNNIKNIKHTLKTCKHEHEEGGKKRYIHRSRRGVKRNQTEV